jgi:hypothetical protein
LKKTAAALIGAFLVVSCTSGPQLEVRAAAPIGGMGVGAPYDPRGVWVSTLGAFCVTTQGEASIDVQLVGAVGLTLDAFTVIPGGSFLLGDAGTMQDHHVPVGTKIMTTVCGPPDVDHAESIIIQVSVNDTTGGHFAAAKVMWSAGARHGVIDVPLELTLKPQGG